MKRQALFLGISAVLLTWPAFAADGVTAMMSVRWGKNAFNFEGMPSGPQPLRNLSRRPDGKSNAGQLVGDYNNPILTPRSRRRRQAEGRTRDRRQGLPERAGPVPRDRAAVQLGDAARL